MGERLTAASRPRPGPWAAAARAVEPCGTQPSACARSPSSPASPRRKGPEDLREKAEIHLILLSLLSLLGGPR